MSSMKLRSRNAKESVVIPESNSDDDDDAQIIDAKLSSLQIKYPDKANITQKKQMLREHKKRESMIGNYSEETAYSIINSADITSPIKDNMFPSDSSNEEVSMSVEQTEKAEAEMMMNHTILRNPYPKYETEKFEAAMKAKITSFEPCTDDDNLQVLRQTYEETCISWQCDAPNPHMRHLHRQHIAAEMLQLAEMGSKQRGIGFQPCLNEMDLARQFSSMGMCVQNVKYSSVHEFLKAQNAQCRSGWLNHIFSRGSNKAPAAPVQNSSGYPKRGQASSSSIDPYIFTDNIERDDNFNMNRSKSNRGRGMRRRKLQRLSVSLRIEEPQASTSMKARKAGSMPYSVVKEQENAELIHCSQCRQDHTLKSLVQTAHLQSCFKDNKCPKCPHVTDMAINTLAKHLAACYGNKNCVSAQARGDDVTLSDNEEDLFQHVNRTRNREKTGGNERANSDSDQAIIQNGPPLKKTRSNETQNA